MGIAEVELTKRAILKTPFPPEGRTVALVVTAWVNAVAPSIKYFAHQDDAVGRLIVRHLLNKGVPARVIAAGLAGTHSRWGDLGDWDVSAALMQFTRRDPNTQNQYMGVPPQMDRSAAKLKIQELEIRFIANPHHPAVQEKIMKDLAAIIGGVANLAGGIHDIAEEREKFETVQRELLESAPTLRQIVRQLGPLALYRLRRNPTPNPPRMPYRPPTMSRRTTAR